MEIIRKFDNTELKIELTGAEIEQAYRIKRKDYNKCDLLCRMNQMLDLDGYENELMVDPEKEYEIGNRTVTGKQLKDLVDDPEWVDGLNDVFEDALDNNDSYWESFWLTAENVIEDEVDEAIPKSEKEKKRDANKEKYKKLIEEIQRSPLPYSSQADIINILINEGV